jgi:hypothetical protein
MRYLLIVFLMLLGSMTSAMAQLSIGIGLPGVSIGINLPVYPELVRVPGYPVYYAPRLNSNFFFYDGMYWVYQGSGGASVCALVHPANSGALLPGAASVLPRLARGCAAPLGRALGP